MALPDNPFESIAMSLSGGGYRAAAFHLGSLHYLHHCRWQGKHDDAAVALLEKVQMISTVSGGTITGVTYAIARAQKNYDFSTYHSSLMKKLGEVDLVKLSLEKLKLDGDWKNTTKRKNLINAFAEIYHDDFTKGATFKDLSILHRKESGLQEVAFNATEFNHGLNFRFQNRGRSGANKNLLPKDALQEVRLADIIAASSCFPGGFEPIAFPDDFIDKQSVKLLALKKEKYPTPFGLMDAGIFDNQGIDSIILSNNRRDTPYDLVIVSDVSSPDMEPFTFFEKQTPNTWRQLTFGKMARNWAWANLLAQSIPVAIALIGFLLFFLLPTEILQGVALGIGFIAIILFLLVWFGRVWIGDQIKAAYSYFLDQIPPYFKQRLDGMDFSSYSLGHVEPLLMDRAKSLKTMVGDVFMKQIRRLSYDLIFEHDEWKFRRIANLIKDLRPNEIWKPKEAHLNPDQAKLAAFFAPDRDEIIGPNIKQLVEETYDFETTLWFTDDAEAARKLEKLEQLGQVTMCFNLIKYTFELLRADLDDKPIFEDDIRKKLLVFYQQLQADWEGFRERRY